MKKNHKQYISFKYINENIYILHVIIKNTGESTGTNWDNNKKIILNIYRTFL